MIRKPRRTEGHEFARKADIGYRQANADLTRQVCPLNVEQVRLCPEVWPKPIYAMIPEHDDVLGQRLTVSQITRNAIPQMLERVAFGGVSFGLTQKGDQQSEDAEILPLRQDLIPKLHPERVLAISAFRQNAQQVVESLDPNDILFLQSRNKVMAALQKPPVDRSAERLPWYHHLPMTGQPQAPKYSEAHYRALQEDPSTSQLNTDFRRPFIPTAFRIERLDGVWRHKNVVAVSSYNYHRWPGIETVDSIAAMPPKALLERVAFCSMQLMIYDSDIRRSLGTLQPILSDAFFNRPCVGPPDSWEKSHWRKLHEAIQPEAVLDALEFWTDPKEVLNMLERLFLGRPFRHPLHLRLGNRIMAELWVSERMVRDEHRAMLLATKFGKSGNSDPMSSPNSEP